MALLFIDSFDHYVTADLTEKWSASAVTGGGAIAIGAGTGRRASQGLQANCGGGSTNPTYYVQKVLPAADATFVVGMAVRVPTGLIGTAGLALAGVRDGGTTQISLRLNNDFTLTVLRGIHNGTVLGTTTATMTAATFGYLELKVLIHPSAGTVDLRLNGVSVLSLTAQNTRASAASQWTSVILGMFDAVTFSALGSSKIADYDDLYVLDGTGAAPWNTFLGDCRVDALSPTAAGATTGWTPSTGANWSCVDETAPNDDTDYTSATTIGLTDTFVVQDIPVAGSVIYGVQHNLSVKKMDAGAALIAPVVRHGGADFVGADIAPGTTYAYGLQVAQVNPGTSAAWTEAGFNAAEFGYKKTG